MIVYDELNQTSRAKKQKIETKFSGRAVSRGVAIGRVVCLHGRKRQFYRIQLSENQIEREARRFRAAIRLAKNQLKKINLQTSENAGEIKVNIFAAHLLILEDKSFLTKIENKIRREKVNAEWAVKIVTDAYIADYKAFADENLRERYIDLEDISDRLVAALLGNKNSDVLPEENAIIVARDVKPSTLIELARNHPKAIITENGGWTSHTFIMAREMNLPAVTGIKGILRRIETGDEVIVDGFNGKIVLYPTETILSEYEIAAKRFQDVREDDDLAQLGGKLKTLDGQEITIRANLDSPEGYLKAKRFGAQGVGLYRSEFLFNKNQGFPSEQEQIKAYSKIAELAGEQGTRIRTFDLCVEQLADEDSEKEQNPALGLRGIRLALARPKQFRIQLSALLQASLSHKIDIVLPMISDVSEILQTKQILQEEKEWLKRENLEFGEPKIGAMIEVPSAILTIDEIAAEVDFLSLGTNDLVQYLLAVDRDNPAVADWFRTLHPAVIRAIKTVIAAADDNGIPVIVCGEMAGSPFYAPILIGLGASVLSMNLYSIPRVRKIVSGIAFEEAREIVKSIEKCRTSDEVENLVRSCFIKKWSHLFSQDILPHKKN